MCKPLITFIFTLACVLCCEIISAYRYSKDLQFWKPKNTETLIRHDNHYDKITDTQGLRRANTQKSVKLIKIQEITKAEDRRWPKVKQHYKWRASTRMTKYSMLQESEPTTAPQQLNSNEKIQTLSSYDIKQYFDELSKKFSKANVTVEVIGRTVEYNDIVILKMTEMQDLSKRNFRAHDDRYVDEASNKKIVFIVHNLVIMGALSLPCMQEEEEFTILVNYYLEHLDVFDIFLIPLANPDGFNHIKYTLPSLGVRSSTVFNYIWNKNCSPQDTCAGVALDRNFDIAWDANHAISSCSQLYPGPKPFSEAETRAIRDIFHKYSNKIIAYFNVHSGTYNFNTFKGDAVLYPKGYMDTHSEEDKYIDLKGEIEEAISNASFKILSVNVDTLYNWYGKVHGSSVDYASSVYGIPFAMEFVMQLYSTDLHNHEYEETYNRIALEQIWKRVISSVFTFMKKSWGIKDSET